MPKATRSETVWHSRWATSTDVSCVSVSSGCGHAGGLMNCQCSIRISQWVTHVFLIFSVSFVGGKNSIWHFLLVENCLCDCKPTADTTRSGDLKVWDEIPRYRVRLMFGESSVYDTLLGFMFVVRRNVLVFSQICLVYGCTAQGASAPWYKDYEIHWKWIPSTVQSDCAISRTNTSIVTVLAYTATHGTFRDCLRYIDCLPSTDDNEAEIFLRNVIHVARGLNPFGDSSRKMHDEGGRRKLQFL